jgi:hypothetical protein
LGIDRKDFGILLVLAVQADADGLTVSNDVMIGHQSAGLVDIEGSANAREPSSLWRFLCRLSQGASNLLIAARFDRSRLCFIDNQTMARTCQFTSDDVSLAVVAVDHQRCRRRLRTGVFTYAGKAQVQGRAGHN